MCLCVYHVSFVCLYWLCPLLRVHEKIEKFPVSASAYHNVYTPDVRKVFVCVLFVCMLFVCMLLLLLALFVCVLFVCMLLLAVFVCIGFVPCCVFMKKFENLPVSASAYHNVYALDLQKVFVCVLFV